MKDKMFCSFCGERPAAFQAPPKPGPAICQKCADEIFGMPCEICGEKAGVTNAETTDGEPGPWVCADCAQAVADDLEETRRDRASNYGGWE